MKIQESKQEIEPPEAEPTEEEILMPKDFFLAYEGIRTDVSTGEISQERINESVHRILRKKFEILAE